MSSSSEESSSGENCCQDTIRVTWTLFLEKQAAEEFVRTSLNAEHLQCFGLGAEISEVDIWKPGHIKPKLSALDLGEKKMLLIG